ncbi:Nn.00g009410.m01.CDS01 [Neocucurbitaria sp. VM-36]
MPVGFGFSVGDFLAVLNLVRIVIEALKSAGGAKEQFAELLEQLHALEKVLTRVKDIELDDEQDLDKIALQHAASQCQETIDGFLARMTKYQPHLGKVTPNRPDYLVRTKVAWMTLRWAVCRADDVAKLKATLNAHVVSMELLLLAVQMKKASIDAKKESKRHDSLVSQICDTSTLFLQKFASIAQQIRDLHDMARTVVIIRRTNLQIFHTVMAMQRFLNRVPPVVEREQPVTLTDPFARVSPFHLEFIRSKECLIAVLRVHFKNAGASTAKLDSGEFIIEDSATKRSINLEEQWEACFQPGQKVAMSVLYKHVRLKAINTCPSCQATCGANDNEDIICSNCGLTFRRIVNLPEEKQRFRSESIAPTPIREQEHDLLWPSVSKRATRKQSTMTDQEYLQSSVQTKRKESPDEEAELEGFKRFRRLGYYPPETQGARCGLWALWDTGTGRKTLQGVCTAGVFNIKGKPFLIVRETRSQGWTLMYEGLLDLNCYVSRFDDERIIFAGPLTYPKYTKSKSPLAHALCFENEHECSTIWYVLPQRNKKPPTLDHIALYRIANHWDKFLVNQSSSVRPIGSSEPQSFVFAASDGERRRMTKRRMTAEERSTYRQTRKRRACIECRKMKTKCTHHVDMGASRTMQDQHLLNSETLQSNEAACDATNTYSKDWGAQDAMFYKDSTLYHLWPDKQTGDSASNPFPVDSQSSTFGHNSASYPAADEASTLSYLDTAWNMTLTGDEAFWSNPIFDSEALSHQKDQEPSKG